MTLKFSAAKCALLLAAAVVVTGFAATSSEAAPRYDRDGRPYYGPKGPNSSYQAGPRTRVYISRRSWLDAGTEVLPGERKFTDYAYPPGQSFARDNLNRPLDRQPLSSPYDLGGFPERFPLY